MDIVTRLKKFMNYLQIANSQFADNLGVPRPTLSQLLSGRNKKVSDEFIAKLHDTYPQLNILWLMFGEGDMLSVENLEFSEPQNGQNLRQSSSQHTEYNLFGDAEIPLAFIPADASNQTEEGIKCIHNPKNDSADSAKEQKTAIKATQRRGAVPSSGLSNQPPSIAVPATSGKKIRSIMVFYSDNSFETFTPASD